MTKNPFTRVLTWPVVLIAFLIVMGTLAFDFALMLTFPHLARNFDPLNPVLALGPTVVILTVVLALTFSWLANCQTKCNGLSKNTSYGVS